MVTRELGVRPLQLLILCLVRQKEGISPGEVSRRFVLDISRVTRFTQSLENAGLLTREREPKDRRYLRLRLTEKGLKLAHDGMAVIDEEFGRRLESLSEVAAEGASHPDRFKFLFPSSARAASRIVFAYPRIYAL
jgi:MarR family transcriptional regulator, organic hydroperoxide resistance regulator